MIRIHRKTRHAKKQSSVMIPGPAQARRIVQPPNRGTVDISAQFQEGY